MHNEVRHCPALERRSALGAEILIDRSLPACRDDAVMVYWEGGRAPLNEVLHSGAVRRAGHGQPICLPEQVLAWIKGEAAILSPPDSLP